MDPVVFILIISVLGPVIGSAIGVAKKPSAGFLYNMLCFAAGVMLAISFLELIPQGIRLGSVGICIAGLVLGSLVMYALDILIPHIHPEFCAQEQGRNLQRTSIYLIMGIFLHNFPEGMAIAVGSATEIRVSFIIALAIAVHNIPEGICTSAPYFHTTGARLRSFLISSSTAVPLLLGFIIAQYLYKSISSQMIGFISGATAGLMIYISSDELIPNACLGTDHKTIFSLIAGVAFVIFLGLI